MRKNKYLISDNGWWTSEVRTKWGFRRRHIVSKLDTRLLGDRVPLSVEW